MNPTSPKPSVYVVAVSGGVDSMVLLHLLQSQNQESRKRRLVVAHLDHGIREDSVEDRRLVARVARDYGLPFVFQEAHLGANASEATAREVRYTFLKQVQASSSAQAIITAHHQDDVLETAVINILRGSGRKGLTALGSHEAVVRPLLNAKKQALIDYAEHHGLEWREDSTNTDPTYLRNHVRHNMLTKFDESARTQLVDIVSEARSKNHEIDSIINDLLTAHTHEHQLDRQWFTHLTHPVAREVMASWLRMSGIRTIDSALLERLVVAAKVGSPGSKCSIVRRHYLVVWKDTLALSVNDH